MSLTNKIMAGIIAFLLLFLAMTGMNREAETARADKAEAQVVQLQGDIKHAQDMSELRAENAKQQLAQATTIAAGLNRQAATILQLPTPAPADRCNAAQALTDSIIREERP